MNSWLDSAAIENLLPELSTRITVACVLLFLLVFQGVLFYLKIKEEDNDESSKL